MSPRTEYPAAILCKDTGERLPSLVGGGWSLEHRSSIAYGYLGGRVVNLNRSTLGNGWYANEVNRTGVFSSGETLEEALGQLGFWPED